MKVLLTATVQSHICQFHKPLVEILHQHGCEVHVAARDNLAEKNGLKLDFVDEVYNVPFDRSPKSMDNIKAYKQLKNIIEAEHYDVIHCNTPMGGIVTRLAARKVRNSRTQVYYTAHGFHFYNGAPKKNWIMFYPIEKFFSRITDKLITITREDYEFARKKFHCDVYHIHGVGVDEERFFPVGEEQKLTLRQKMGYTSDQKIIICIGELLPNKNQTMAIHMMQEVVKRFPDALLLLAGNGPDKEHLEQEIAATGMQNNVKLLGYCTNLQDYLHISDLSVSCSKREGLPLNIVEAMLSATPVVATKNRGHCELIHEGENSFLVYFNDIQAMAKQVKILLEDKNKNAEVGANARIYAEQYGFKPVKKELRIVYGVGE